MKTNKTLRALLCGLLLAGAVVYMGCGKEEAENAFVPEVENEVSPSSAHPSMGTRVDRMGMPAVSTVTITSKDAYNHADPIDDAAGTFVGEIVANLTAIHGALDDDLTGLGLTPCAVGDCVSQAAPLVVPDVIRIDPSRPAGFPNGRRLTDPVIDITLAVLLLDLHTHSVTSLLGVNPTANDRPFGRRFPYLAPPHRTP